MPRESNDEFSISPVAQGIAVAAGGALGDAIVCAVGALHKTNIVVYVGIGEALFCYAANWPVQLK